MNGIEIVIAFGYIIPLCSISTIKIDVCLFFHLIGVETASPIKTSDLRFRKSRWYFLNWFTNLNVNSKMYSKSGTSNDKTNTFMGKCVCNSCFKEPHNSKDSSLYKYFSMPKDIFTIKNILSLCHVKVLVTNKLFCSS